MLHSELDGMWPNSCTSSLKKPIVLLLGQNQGSNPRVATFARLLISLIFEESRLYILYIHTSVRMCTVY